MKKILIVLLILVSLFIIASCNMEPEKNPTDAPAPGEIPAVPNEDTEIKSVGDEDKVAIQTLFNDLMLFISNLTGEGAKDILSDPSFYLNGTVTLSAPARSIKIGDNTLQNGAILATLKADDAGINLEATSSVKIGEAESEDLSFTFNFATMSGTIQLGEDTIVITEDEDDTIIKLNDVVLVDDEDDDADEYDLLTERLETVALAIVNGLSKATISFDKFLGSYAIPDVGTLSVTASGNLKFDVSLNQAYFATETGSPINSGSITFSNFDVSVKLDDVEGGLMIDDMELSVGSVAITKTKDDAGRTSSTSFKAGLDAKEISLFVKHSGLLKATMTYADLDIDVDYSYSYEVKNSPYSYESNSVCQVSASTDFGFGLMVGSNSMGIVTNVKLECADMDEFDPEKNLTITPLAAVLNGDFYDPEQFLAALIEVGSTVFGD